MLSSFQTQRYYEYLKRKQSDSKATKSIDKDQFTKSLQV